MKIDVVSQDGAVLVIGENWAIGRWVSRVLTGLGLTPIVAAGQENITSVVADVDVVGIIVVSPGVDRARQMFFRDVRQTFTGAFLVALVEQLDEQDEVRALLSGADQCFRYPMPEPIFRVHVLALLDRLSVFRETIALGNEIRKFGGVDVDLGRNCVWVMGECVELTPTEMRLLEVLSRTPGRMVSKSALAYSLWGWDGDVYDEHIKCHVSRIRAKLRQITRWEVIQTVRGRGYCFVTPA